MNFMKHLKYLFLGIPLIWFLIVALSWSTRINRAFTHDEPHYFIIANSIIHDFDFDLKNNYENEARKNEFIGKIDRHGIEHNGGFYSQHAIGVPIILVPYVYFFGFEGIKFYLVFILGLSTIFVIYRCFRYYLDTKISLIATVVYMCSMPFLLSSSLAFPEQFVGIISCQLILILYKKYDQIKIKNIELIISFILSAFLALLNFRYIVVSGAFFLFFIYLDKNYILNKRYFNWSNFLIFSSFGFVLILTLIYNRISFGGVFSNGYAQKQLYFDLPSVSMQMLSFLIDINQGVICQEVLVFCCLPFLLNFIKYNNFKSTIFIVFFLLILIPGSLVLYHHQGGAFIPTRFTWPLTLLFVFPVGYCISLIQKSKFHSILYFIYGFSISYNLVLFCFWIEEYTENIFWYKSCNFILNIPGLEPYLPNFRNYEDFARGGINIVYLILILSLITASTIYANVKSKPKFYIGFSLVFIVLTFWYLNIYNQKTWFFTKVFSPKNTYYSVNLGKQPYTSIIKDRHSDVGWSVYHHTVGENMNITFGPYTILTKGNYVLKVSLKSNLNISDVIGNIDAVYNKDNALHVLLNREYTGSEVYSNDSYKNVEIPFTITDDNITGVEFRVFTRREMDVYINKIVIKKN